MGVSGVDVVSELELLLNYRFLNRQLLEDALIHSSIGGPTSYERLEFVGDAAITLAFTNHVYMTYPTLPPGDLSLLRAANISTEKLARVAVKHGFYNYLLRDAPNLDVKVSEFIEAINKSPDEVDWLMKAPKVLADVVESIAGAVFVDSDYNLQMLWNVFRKFFEPIINPVTLKNHPLTELQERCQKKGEQLEFSHKNKGNLNVFHVLVDGKFMGKGSNEVKEVAKLCAVKDALANYMKIEEESSPDTTLMGTENDPKLEKDFDEDGGRMPLDNVVKREPTSPMIDDVRERKVARLMINNVKEERKLLIPVSKGGTEKESWKHILQVYCCRKRLGKPTYEYLHLLKTMFQRIAT
ncbi:hypothetical protein AMTR_s00007p00252700 [Amborella trichopoda]|uniref:RNase III domain-containing protein n=1 Tax=Amborella trichopoda TaxID=13333 RepID=W1PCN6_AMBTC|nr:hypothetical protein AMTR_s00007p00252700 [Amborella trichopoda]